MKIQRVMLVFTMLIATLIGTATVLQQRFAAQMTNQAVADQEALVKSSALMDDIRLMQIEFKWQVQSFKDVVLRGGDPDLMKRYAGEYEDHYAKTSKQIDAIAAKLQAPEFAMVAAKFKGIKSEHDAVSGLYRNAITMYQKLVTGPKVDFDMKESADIGVRGIDREITEHINDTAGFMRDLNAKNAAAVSAAARAMQADMTRATYAIGAMGCLLAVVLGLAVTYLVMRLLGAEPALLNAIMKKIAGGDMTTQMVLKDGDESSCAANLYLMQMKMRSLVVGIRDETRGALTRVEKDGDIAQARDDLAALNKSIRKFRVDSSVAMEG